MKPRVARKIQGFSASKIRPTWQRTQFTFWSDDGLGRCGRVASCVLPRGETASFPGETIKSGMLMSGSGLGRGVDGGIQHTKSFGKLLSQHRKRLGQGLREFSRAFGVDAAYISRLERDLLLPPQDPERLASLADALGLAAGTVERLEFTDIAAAATGRIPKDLSDDPVVVRMLPVLFRGLRKGNGRAKPETIARLLRRSWNAGRSGPKAASARARAKG